MILSIVAALVIFYYGIPLAFALFLWAVTELVEHPLQTVVVLFLVFLAVASIGR